MILPWAVGLEISNALHNSVMVYFPVLHSQINSIFCSIVVVSFQGHSNLFFIPNYNLKKCKGCPFNFVNYVPLPYQNLDPDTKKNERVFLSQNELQKIEDSHFDIDRLQLVRDLFVFSCYTGLSYIDVMELTKDSINFGVDGNLWVITKRHKTNNTVRIPILPQAGVLIQKYAAHPRAIQKGTLFLNLSNQKLNAYLKEMADLCRIKKKLTFHIARHTFATTVTLTNGVPIETVSKILGHSRISTTQIYAKIIERKVSGDMKIFKSKLLSNNSNLKKQLT